MKVKELIKMLETSNPDADVWANIADEEQDINDQFELIDVDGSMAHPYTVYLSNVCQ